MALPSPFLKTLKPIKPMLIRPILITTLVLAAIGTTQAQDEEGAQAYRSIYAKRFPRIVENAPSPALPVRLATAPIRVTQKALNLERAEHVQEAQMFREFYAAADSDDIPTAKRRFQKFIQDHTMPGEEYECPTTARLCEWSKEELARAQALEQGRTVEAERIEKAVPVNGVR